MKQYLVIFCMLVMAVESALAQQFDVVSRVREAREKAKAVRAARVDAMRQLGESIQGVRISSKTVVKDFVTESDEINADFMAFLQGAQQEGQPQINPDGTVEVTLVMYMDELVNGLKSIRQNNRSSTISSPEQFQKMRSYGRKAYRATGTGAMSQEPLPPLHVDVWTYVSPRGKAMARRAAQADAYRNMGETLQGVKVTSKTTVRDFVTESDQIFAQFQGVVRGVEFTDYVYLREGIVRVTAQIDVDKLVNMLSSIYPGQSFEGIRRFQRYQPGNVITTSGVGAPPARYIRRRPMYPSPVENKPDVIVPPRPPVPAPPVFPNMPAPPRPPERFVPEWANRHITVTGTGAYPQGIPRGQAKAMAERAAQLDAYRLLVEQAMGVHLQGQTTVQDFITTKDEITSEVNGYLRGAQMVDTRDLGPMEGLVEVDMKLYLGDMWEIIDAEYQKTLYQKYGRKLEDYQPDYLRYQAEMQKYKQKLDNYQRQYQSRLTPQYQREMRQNQERYRKSQTQLDEFERELRKYKRGNW